ncbi:MAG: AAA family ATPase [Rikenellaceae bacterium]|nr:AAA family ATPase [Rikenellaceae bacterium]
MLSEHISSQIYSNFNFVPTIGQKKLIDRLSVYTTERPSGKILMVNGYAGTGKTTAISAYVKTLEKFHIKYTLLAPTGRAAKVLATSSGSKAYTIHKKIYRQKSLSSEFSSFSLAPNLNKDTIFIVDEVSMLSNFSLDNSIFGSGRLLDDLVGFVNSGVNCKLILVGDSAQLPPVGLDNSPALDPDRMSQYGETELVVLDEVMRQQEDSGILFNATLLRCMLEENIIDIPMFRTSFPDIKSIGGGEFLEKLSEAYDKYGMDNTIVITRSNKRANKFNEGIRRHILCRDEPLNSGDMLMIVKNNYYFIEKKEDEELDFIANGDTAELVKIKRYDEQFGFRFADVRLRFPDYDELEIDCKINLDTLESFSPSLTQEQSRELFYRVEEDYSHLTTKKKRYAAIREDSYYNALQVKFAYSVTCHKAQGGQWGCVFIDKMLFGEEEMSRDLMRWLYTAITRATDMVFLVNFDERFFE